MRTTGALGATILIITIGSAGTTAQTVSLGVRTGVGVASAVFEDDFSSGRVDGRWALQVGALATRHLSRGISVRAELLYAQRGWNEQRTGGGRRLSYLDVPLLVGFHAPWKLSPHLVLGPALSIEVGCAVTGVPEAGTVGCDDTHIGWDRSRILLSGHGGIGVSAPLYGGRVLFEVLIKLTRTNLNREQLPRGFIGTGSAVLSVGYTVPIGGG